MTEPETIGDFSHMGAGLEQSFRRAKALSAKGNVTEAARIYGEVLERYPGNRKARKALSILPVTSAPYKDPAALFARALDLHRNGAPDAAIEAYAMLLATVPDHADGLNNLGALLIAQGETDAAIAACRRAIAARPGLARAHNNLGAALRKSGDLHGAVDAFGTALELEPDNADVLNNLGTALKATGRGEVAANCFKRALALRPSFADCAKNLAMLTGKDENPALRRHIRAIHDASPPGSENRMLAAYALADLGRKDGHIEATLAWLEEAAAIGKRLSRFDFADSRTVLATLKQRFASPPEVPVTKPAPITPIFIVGMPRSGTTLLDQILISHDAVSGAGELHLLTHLIEQAGGPVASTNPEALARIRDGYLAGIARYANGAGFVTDKMPLNFRWVGHIRAALPEAKIIHMARQPEAVCWSTYRLHFPSPGMAYSFDQRDIAQFHLLHDDLMTFWKEQHGPAIHTQSYADLTEAPEDQARHLTDWLGLDWNPALLEFHKTERAIDTASAMQVRQKIYTGSSEDWRAFEHGLGPMLEILHGTDPTP